MDTCAKNSSVSVKSKNIYHENGSSFVRIKRKIIKKTIRKYLKENQTKTENLRMKLLRIVKKIMFSAFLFNRQKNISLTQKASPVPNTISPDQLKNITKSLIFSTENDLPKAKHQKPEKSEKTHVEPETTNAAPRKIMPFQF